MISTKLLSHTLLASTLLLGTPLLAGQPAPDASKPATPLTITLSDSSVSQDNGIQLRVTVHNVSDTPVTLSLCPKRESHCLDNMFVAIGYSDTGKSLCNNDRDAENSEKHQICLVKDATYSFPMAIALDTLPQECQRKENKQIDFKLGFLADAATIYSDTIKLSLP